MAAYGGQEGGEVDVSNKQTTFSQETRCFCFVSYVSDVSGVFFSDVCDVFSVLMLPIVICLYS